MLDKFTVALVCMLQDAGLNQYTHCRVLKLNAKTKRI